jgi:hypothetical protein
MGNAKTMTETSLQIAIVKRLHERGILAVHVPNEGSRGVKGGAIAKAKGLVTGCPDILCLCCLVAIEVKAPGEEPTRKQEQFLRVLRALGWEVGVARSVEEAMEIVERKIRP